MQTPGLEKNRLNAWIPYVTLIALGLLIRLMAAMNAHAVVDVNNFKFWSQALFEHGFSNFYSSEDYSVYPAGYLYVLRLLGAVRQWMGLAFESGAFTMLMKAPAMLCDVAAALLVFKVARSHMAHGAAWLLAAAYAANPAVILDSAVWGQVDAVYTLILLGSVYYIAEKKYMAGFLMFPLAVLVNTQALLFTPIYIYAAFNMAADGGFKAKAYIDLAFYIVCFIFIIMLGNAPFTHGFSLSRVLTQYDAVMHAYPYATVNAYNLYALIGANWADLSATFLSLSYRVWGMVFLDVIVLLGLFLLQRKPVKANYFFIGALLNALAFVFCVEAHERYLFATFIFLIMAYAYAPDKRYMLLYAGFSLTFFINCTGVLNILETGASYDTLDAQLPPFSLINVLLSLFMVYTAFAPAPKPKPVTAEAADVGVSAPAPRLARKDYILCGVLMLVYGMLAFYNLGNTVSPQNAWTPINKEAVVIDFGETQKIDDVVYMLGVNGDQTFKLSTSGDAVNWRPLSDIDAALRQVFAWDTVQLDCETRYVKIEPQSDALSIQEMAFRRNGELLAVTTAPGGWGALFDEQQTVPARADYLNSTYFDEIYHARTAYEFIHHMRVYEWTHPPFGKFIISLGIRLFGMAPFGWRFMGTLFGVFMIFPMYAFGKKMFGQTGLAFLTAFLFTFDFMHFAQTRIATIDTYVTFFIICMTYFMYCYTRLDFTSVTLRRTLWPLGFSGLFMGLGIASKWPGLYAAAGLAVLFFVCLFRQYRQYTAAVPEEPRQKRPLIPKWLTITLAWCVVFFVVVPLIVYLLAYIPFLGAPDQHGIGSIIKNQRDMYQYHSTLVSEHPYSSVWWWWPFDIRPIFYYAGDLGNGIKEGISSFGNPAVWWFGVAAFCYCVYRVSRYHDETAQFLLIAFLAQFVPWTFVTRTTYIYHYFPCVPFLVLMIVYFLKKVVLLRNAKLVYAYAAVVFILFAAFYPVLSGMPIPEAYARALEWLPKWQLL